MITGKRFLTLLITGFIIAGWGTPVQAQSTHLTAKNLGLGGGGTAYIDDFHANFVNPANIMLGEGDTPRSSLGLFGGLSTNAGGSLINLNVYNNYFTKGLTITDDVADEVLNKWFGADPSQLKKIGIQTDITPFGFSYRGNKWGTSLALRSRILMNTGINKGLAQLGIMGFDRRVFGDGQPVNFTFETLSIYEASVGFSYKILEMKNLFGFAKNVKIHAGVAPKVVLGANATKVDFNSTLTLNGTGPNDIDEIRHQFNYSFETTGEISNQLRAYYEAKQNQQETPDIGNYVEPTAEDFYGIKANNFGLDIGGTIEMDLNVPIVGVFFRGPEHLKVGLSVTDLGSLSFTENIGRFAAEDELVWRGFDFDAERIDEEFNGNRGEYIDHVLQDSIMKDIYSSFAPEEISQITHKLPTMLNFGSQLTLNKLSVSVDLRKGFNDKGINSERVSVSTGVEYDLLGFLPLRVGMRNGGYSSTSYSAGFGLEFRNFEFSFAASSVANSLNNGSSAGVAWSGLIFRF